MTRILSILLFIGIINYSFGQDPKRFQKDIDKFKEIDKKDLSQGEILFVGSSSVRFWNTLQEDFPKHKVINRGFGGSHMSDLLFYLDDLVLKYKPKQVFVYEGDNDINDKESPKDILKEAETLVKRIHKALPKTEIVFISPKPSIARWNLKSEYQKLNYRLKAFTNQYSYVKFVDVWQPMLDAKGDPIKDIFIEDNLHMNAKGYEIWQKTIEPYLMK